MAQNIQPSTSKESVKKLRFTAGDDLALLRECVAFNPLEEVERWEEIQKNISIITLKDHLFLILDIFLKKDKTTQIMSGVEEMYSERDQLLQEVSGMCQKAEVNSVIKKRKMSKEKQISELDKQSRDECSRQLLPKNLKNLSAVSTPTLDHNYSNVIIYQDIDVLNEIESNTFSPVEPAVIDTDLDIEVEINVAQTQKTDSVKRPKKSRTNKSGALRKTALDYLQNKEAKEQRVKIKQLDLEQRRLNLGERRLVLDEKRLQMEVAEKKEKLEIEQARFKQEIFERDQQLKLIEQQHKLIVYLIESVKKYENK
ncbi:hypothetical protein FQA39_LY08037 [Lamprigera yunnana]|nr:hypothetical protein FQA39_LY08037 [Lamprigera yunnana]